MTTVANATAGRERTVKDTHALIELLSLLLDGYALVGKFPHPSGGKWAAKQELHEYLIFTKVRACPFRRMARAYPMFKLGV